MKKKIAQKVAAMLLAALVIILIVPVVAKAEDTSRSYQFSLTSDGTDTITAAPNQVITVSFALDRTDAQDAYLLFAMQDEIQYDPSFFEFVEGSLILGNSVMSTDLGMRDGTRRLYVNYLSLAGGTEWPASATLATFQLKVLADSGVSVISNQDYLVSNSGAEAFAASSSDLTVIATTDCIVRFESNGGTETPNQKVKYGEHIVPPNEPEREGYSFVDWYRDIDLTKEWILGEDIVAQSMVLYARWSAVQVIPDAETPQAAGSEIPVWIWPISLLALVVLSLLFLLLLRKKTITFEPNGGTPLESITLMHGKLISHIHEPIKEQSTFLGWYKDQALKYAWDFDNDKVSKDLTLYAKWNSESER